MRGTNEKCAPLLSALQMKERKKKQLLSDPGIWHKDLNLRFGQDLDFFLASGGGFFSFFLQRSVIFVLVGLPMAEMVTNGEEVEGGGGHKPCLFHRKKYCVFQSNTEISSWSFSYEAFWHSLVHAVFLLSSILEITGYYYILTETHCRDNPTTPIQNKARARVG